MDVARLRESFARVAAHGGDAVALHFYSDLFLRHPEVRDLFPVSMAVQRDHLIGALVKIVAEADRADSLAPYLAHLGRAHRKFGALAAHYPAVGASLLATLEHFAGETWTPEVAQDWAEAYGLIAKLMSDAAAADEQHAPPWWAGEVTAAERRAYDITVLRVALPPGGAPLEWAPGSPSPWRPPDDPGCGGTTPRPAPPVDGVVEFHVRWVDGGQVSPALAGLTPGDRLRIGPPAGVMTLDTESGRDVLMCAWSTGLAPLKAILAQVQQIPEPAAGAPVRRRAPAGGPVRHARTREDRCRVPVADPHPVVAEGPGFPGETGRMGEVVARRGDWVERDAYLAGPGEVVGEVAAYLAGCGVPRERVRTEDFGWSGR